MKAVYALFASLIIIVALSIYNDSNIGKALSKKYDDYYFNSIDTKIYEKNKEDEDNAAPIEAKNKDQQQHQSIRAHKESTSASNNITNKSAEENNEATVNEKKNEKEKEAAIGATEAATTNKIICEHPKIIATACIDSRDGINTTFCMLKRLPYILGNDRLKIEIRVLKEGEQRKYDKQEDVELRDPCVQHIILNSQRNKMCSSISIFSKSKDLREKFASEKGGKYKVPQRLADLNLGSVYWNPEANLIPLKNPKLQLSKDDAINRPLSMRLASEVMTQISAPDAYPNDDAVYFRAYGSRHLVPKSLGIHYIQGFTHSCTDRAPSYMITGGLWDKKMTDEDFRKILKGKKSLAALSASSVMKSVHLPDAVLRWTICALLKQYKACDVVTKNNKMPMVSWEHLPGKKWCNGTDLDSWVCFKPYKFALAMENTQIDGYLSEKAIMAALAHTVPVYFGNRDVFKFLNPRRFVLCAVSDHTIERLRSFKKDNKLQIPFVSAKEIDMPFLDNGFTESNYPGTSDYFNKVRWGVKELKDELNHCIEEIKYLDQHDEAFIAKLKEPFYLDNRIEDSAFDGTYSARGLINVLKVLKSPLLANLDAESKPGLHPNELSRRVHHDDLEVELASAEIAINNDIN